MAWLKYKQTIQSTFKMTKIKISILGLLALILNATIFVACSNGDDEIPSQVTTQEIKNIQLNPSDFKIIGKEHNRILELTFVSLEKELLSDNGSAKIMSKNGKYYSSKFSTIDEVLKYAKSVIKKDISKNKSKYSKSDIVQKSINVSLNSVDEVFEMKTPLMEDGKLYNKTLESELTSKVRFYLSSLNNILIDEDNSLGSLKERIHILETAISQANLNASEQAILYTATNTASSSLSYWNENYNNWVDTLPLSIDGFPPRPEGTLNGGNKVSVWKNVGKADIAGAIAGAVGAAVLNIAPGPGQVAYGSAIISGAASASIYEGVMSVFNGNCVLQVIPKNQGGVVKTK